MAQTETKPKLKRIRPTLIAAAVIIILELFVFNLPFWQSLNAHPTTMHEDGTGKGLLINRDGTATVTNPDNAWRDVSTNQPIEYLYIAHAAAEHPSQDDSVSWQLSTRKDTDGGWYDANATVGYSPSAEDSRYQRVGGKATHVRLRYQMEEGATIPIGQIIANPRIPMRFSMLRFALELLVAGLIILFRPRSRLYRMPFDLSRFGWRARDCWMPLLLAGALACAIPLFFFMQAAPLEEATPLYWPEFASLHATDQYQRLADSLLNGQLWLDYPVNSHLAAMANPYDTRARAAIGLTYPDPPIYFDVAFYHGHYYSYFGVLPALLLYAPWKLITGNRLDTNMAIMICVTLVMIASTWLVVQIARLIAARRGRTVSLGAVLLGVIMAGLGTGMPILIQLGLWYQVPQQLAVFFAMCGVALWIEAKLQGLNRTLLAAGSLCVALTIASRPQVMAIAVFALPLFWDDIAGLWRRGLRSLAGLRDELMVWAFALVPFVAVAVPQCLYNLARFGKLTDFGANYNLTGYDMTHFNAPLTQYFSYVYYYFLRMPYTTARFPFVNPVETPLTTWRSEHVQFGGYFVTTAPFAMLLFTVFVWRFALRRLAAGRLIAGALVAAVLSFIVDGRITGVDFRYQIDFVWMIMIAVLVLLFAIDGCVNGVGSDSDDGDVRYRGIVQRLVFGFLVAALVYAVLFVFFKQYLMHMNMPVGRWWTVESWFIFM
ncbi:hypothetical protein [Bifidobacterium leontopitheci]|nr:hypothetical protein [Bifidobacterium leontopitheci]